MAMKLCLIILELAKEDSEAIMQWASGTSKHKAFAVGNLWINEWIQDESEIVQLYDQILNESIDESVDLIYFSLFTWITYPNFSGKLYADRLRIGNGGLDCIQVS